jgi:hypothetical protein
MGTDRHTDVSAKHLVCEMGGCAVIYKPCGCRRLLPGLLPPQAPRVFRQRAFSPSRETQDCPEREFAAGQLFLQSIIFMEKPGRESRQAQIRERCASRTHFPIGMEHVSETIFMVATFICIMPLLIESFDMEPPDESIFCMVPVTMISWPT